MSKNVNYITPWISRVYSLFPSTQEPPRILSNRHVVDDFAQRLWAYKTIKLLLQKLKIALTQEETDDLYERALELSLKYRFVTPLTSLVVVQPKKTNKAKSKDENKDEGVIESGEGKS